MGRGRTNGGGSLLVLFALIAGSVVSCVNWIGEKLSPESADTPETVQVKYGAPGPLPSVAEQKPKVSTTVVESVFVIGKGVALRSQPSKSSTVIDRLDLGYQLERIGTSGEWSEVIEPASKSKGWVSTSLLSKKAPNPTPTPSVKKTTVKPKIAAGSGCDRNYSGDCVPIASDVDCAGGRGNGPAYVAGPVTVVGSDIYDLDRDGDGIGCE